MPSGMRLMLENDSLKNASPSMVSRLGIVAMDASTLTWRSVVYSWLESRGEDKCECPPTSLDALFLTKILCLRVGAALHHTHAWRDAVLMA
jgi:hypothetical protein